MAGQIDYGLAIQYCTIIQEQLTTEELQAVNDINDIEQTSDYCATSEFTDTRVVMHEGFQNAFGYSLENADATKCEMANDTWDACKSAHFDPSQFEKKIA